MTRKLRRSADPASRGVLVTQHSRAVIRGNSDWDYQWPGCGRVLLSKVEEFLPMANAAVKCYDCGTVSDVPGQPAFQ